MNTNRKILIAVALVSLGVIIGSRVQPPLPESPSDNFKEEVKSVIVNHLDQISDTPKEEKLKSLNQKLIKLYMKELTLRSEDRKKLQQLIDSNK